MKNIFLALLVLKSTFILAQDDTLNKLTFNGFADVYYSYDFSNPQNHQKPDFVYNHKRHNEINLNLILLRAKYLDKNFRSNVGLMAGNYAQYNLSSEPIWAQFVYEANIGVKLSKKHTIWLDAGIMPSHIGSESAISSICWTLSRSLMAENSPYYQAGLKLNFTNKKENIKLALLALNGWQSIQRPDYMQLPSFGFQVNYKTFNKLTLNYSNFIGSVKPDSLKAIRAFHNFYIQYEPKAKFAFIAGFDIGTDKYNPTDYGIWFSPIVILRYALNDKMKIALRGEHYNDEKQIIIPTNSINGFQVTGLSTNFDYALNNKIGFRIEGKMYHSKDKIFLNNANINYSLTTNMTIRI